MAKPTKKTVIKKKFLKDKNAPKKPLTAYFVFMNENRAEFKANNPDKKVTEIGKLLGAKWRELSDEEKKEYTDKSLKLKEEYLKVLEKYNQSDDKKKYEKEKRKWEKKQKEKVKKIKKKKKAKKEETEEESGSNSEEEYQDSETEESD